MKDPVVIRIGVQADYDSIADVMFDAVRFGKSHYSPDQRAAWMPERRSGPEWYGRLNAQRIWVAEDSCEMLGIMSLADHGYIDLAFIRPSAQGSGLFRKLYEQIERTAVSEGQTRLRVHASLMAEPAFSKMGFIVIAKESVEVRGQTLDRFEMEKRLEWTAAPTA
jgi:putative acetyltransferase